ncbi:MAG: GNAT family N-acetyltransferase [Spirochaetes bacterium]|nr:GNAT family N-acetyltransferase [Spirochaetota bacterium]MBU0954108.1 GNAT family N-acetyltransferase [Spirochaetota bacterium]
MTKFKYVEMICTLDQANYNDKNLIEDIAVKPISSVESDLLFDCYFKAFSIGDAKFFKLQNDNERRRYFNEELGFPEVLACPASFIYKLNDKTIGFALVLPYLEDNYHISCMCILPEYQNRKLGKAMLNRIKNIALENNCKTLTLGTETEMRAYHLYKNNGFNVTEEHIVEI